MKKIFVTRLIVPVFLMAFSGCAAKPSHPTKVRQKYVPPSSVKTQLSEWDHDKIRQVRETEQAMSSPDTMPHLSKTKDCVVMSRELMLRGKVIGCKPLDAKSGMGEDSYCCPAQNDDE